MGKGETEGKRKENGKGSRKEKEKGKRRDNSVAITYLYIASKIICFSIFLFLLPLSVLKNNPVSFSCL